MPATRLLLTRPYEQSVRFGERIAERYGDAFELLVSPVMAIEPLGPLPDLTGLAGLVFTSQNAVQVFGSLGGRFPGVAWCVGDRTAEAARALGMAARSAGGTVSNLADLIACEAPGTRLLHLRVEYAAGDLVAQLVEAGVSVHTHTIYRQPAVSLTGAARHWLSDSAPVILPVFSPRAARLLNPELKAAQAPFRIAAMSPAVADALDVQTGRRIEIAARPDAEAMLDLLVRLVS
jgi:uroporphyrinogen-III synthase